MGLFSGGHNAKLSEELIVRALSTVQEPELGGDLIARNMIKGLKVDGGRVSFTIELTTPACPLKDQIQDECLAAIERVAFIDTRWVIASPRNTAGTLASIMPSVVPAATTSTLW